MIKIFLESDKFSHKAGVTKHATNTLARKSHQDSLVAVRREEYVDEAVVLHVVHDNDSL